jgi:hypothetical protein
MAEAKNGKSALTHAVAGLLAAAATWLIGHAVSPAQAAQASGLATAEQVMLLERKVDRFIERVESIEKKQTFEEGVRAASHRGPPR